jgi:hypothetical protein
MVLVEAAVNSSIEGCVTPWSGRCRAQSDARRSTPTVLVMQRNKRCVQMHNSPNRERYLAAIALRSPHRSRQVSSGKAPSR